jgi:seryl-tRNA synthetase
VNETGEEQEEQTEGAAVEETREAGWRNFREQLIEAGLLVLTGIDGIYGRSRIYEDVVTAVGELVIRTTVSEEAIGLRFPPVLPRKTFELSGYLSSFPDLIGSISTFKGDNRDHMKLLELAEAGDDWTTMLEPADVTLCSAACHPLYPTLKGVLPPGGSRYDVSGWCFRHEPSVDPARMQAFRQHELVYVGSAAGAREHRDRWLQLGLGLLGGLGLAVESVVANDPFFGRVGQILANNQREETLKYEIVSPIHSEEHPTAIASANCHLDHFGLPFGIVTDEGEVAHSCCIGFGLDRVTLALLRTHGLQPGDWPAAARDQLWP